MTVFSSICLFCQIMSICLFFILFGDTDHLFWVASIHFLEADVQDSILHKSSTEKPNWPKLISVRHRLQTMRYFLKRSKTEIASFSLNA